jgi:hypothetical protein
MPRMLRFVLCVCFARFQRALELGNTVGAGGVCESPSRSCAGLGVVGWAGFEAIALPMRRVGSVPAADARES